MRPQREGEGQPAGAAGPSEIVIPVAEEEIVVGVQARETARVRVRKTVESEELVVNTRRAHEDVKVERVTRDLELDAPPAVRTEGDVTIVPVVEEVIVFQKRYRVREEIRITRTRVEEVHPFRITRHRERAEVIDLPPESVPASAAAAAAAGQEQGVSTGGSQRKDRRRE